MPGSSRRRRAMIRSMRGKVLLVRLGVLAPLLLVLALGRSSDATAEDRGPPCDP